MQMPIDTRLRVFNEILAFHVHVVQQGYVAIDFYDGCIMYNIGIVLSCGNNSLIVAESNVDNKNVSGILNRKRNDTIGCYIRIAKDYAYDGWEIDFKTDEMKVVNR